MFCFEIYNFCTFFFICKAHFLWKRKPDVITSFCLNTPGVEPSVEHTCANRAQLSVMKEQRLQSKRFRQVLSQILCYGRHFCEPGGRLRRHKKEDIKPTKKKVKKKKTTVMILNIMCLCWTFGENDLFKFSLKIWICMSSPNCCFFFSIFNRLQVCAIKHLWQVRYRQQLLQPGQKHRHHLLQSLVVVRAIIYRKNLLQTKKNYIIKYIIGSKTQWIFFSPLTCC